MISNYRVYLISIIIFIFAYSILGFNLDGQGIFIDEVFHHTFGMIWYDSVMKGDLLNPCVTGIGDCDMLNTACNVHVSIATGGIIKGIFTGIGDEFLSETERTYYSNLEPCRPIHKNIAVAGENIPSSSELGSARFFFPIFGSLAIVVSFLIGRTLFSNSVGIVFASVLLFHSLSMLYSRIIQSEIFVIFFMLLSILLILYSVKNQGRTQIKYLVLGAIIFALAVNVKLTALELFPLLFIMILWRSDVNEKFHISKIKDKKFLRKSIFLFLLFLTIVFSTIIITNPYYYVDPISQLNNQYQNLQDFQSVLSDMYSTWSPLQKFYMPFLGTFSVTIYPVIDAYYYVFGAENIPQSVVNGYAFVSVPLTILFFVGAWYLLRKIMKKELLFSELLIVIWFLSFFVTISLGNDSFTQTKYYVPMILPIVLVMAYGFVRCLNNILNKAIQKIFFITTIAAHAVTYLIFWENIYFNPEKIWRLPLDINFQKSISDPIVLLCSVIFLISFFIIIAIKAKSRQIFR